MSHGKRLADQPRGPSRANPGGNRRAILSPIGANLARRALRSAPGVGAGHGLPMSVTAGGAAAAVVGVAAGGAVRDLGVGRPDPGPKPLAQLTVIEGVRPAAVVAPAGAVAVAGQGAVGVFPGLTLLTGRRPFTPHERTLNPHVRENVKRKVNVTVQVPLEPGYGGG